MAHAAAQQTQLSMGQRFRNWRSVLATANLPTGAAMDVISKWLLITRAAVFSMTLISGLIGGLLAITAEGRDVAWLNFALALAGLVVAHASNNMINDYFDVAGGVDDLAYPRAQYAPHPLLSGLTSKRTLIAAILLTNAIDGAIALYLAWAVGPLVLVFALAGLFVSAGYVMQPIVLKRRGLGEIGVLIVWGPLMIGGTYYVTAGDLPAWVWAACAPYSLIVMSVLIGKHLDKYDIDKAKGIKTLPVVLGYGVSMRLNQAIMIAFYPVVGGLVVTAYSRCGRSARCWLCPVSSQCCGSTASRARMSLRPAIPSGRSGTSPPRSTSTSARANCSCWVCCWERLRAGSRHSRTSAAEPLEIETRGASSGISPRQRWSSSSIRRKSSWVLVLTNDRKSGSSARQSSSFM